jgi:hypothetical protein
MRREALFLPAAALVAVALLIAAHAVQAQGTLKPVEARIVNTPTQPVPVTVLSAPAPAGEGSREIYSQILNLPYTSGNSYACASAQLPAGKRLVVQHLGALSVQVGTPLFYVGMAPAPGTELDLIVPAAAPLSSTYENDFFTRAVAGQQVHAYYDTQYMVCVQGVGNLNRNSMAQVRGYLVARP